MIATLFVHPMEIPAAQAIFWLLPLTFGVALAYRAMRCEDISKVWHETISLFVKILLGMAILAAGFWSVFQIFL
ncbi:MAG: hypothetical protein HN909_04075 [Phycisphaerales bacterium]|jgi:hypothetical protein|nr:hypothetical protein [Phycisphaerales bacterium]MBT7170929.1 hypothetical protein [Phycisphaerales bacterium]